MDVKKKKMIIFGRRPTTIQLCKTVRNTHGTEFNLYIYRVEKRKTLFLKEERERDSLSERKENDYGRGGF